jgi:kinesin family member 22
MGSNQIAKAVETEVARRLEEREKERERLREEQEQQGTAIPDSSESSPKQQKETLPPGVLTPLLKRHRDLDDELKQRLHELERKLYDLSGFPEYWR